MSFIAAVLNRSTSTTLSSDDAELLNKFSSLFGGAESRFWTRDTASPRLAEREIQSCT